MQSKTIVKMVTKRLADSLIKRTTFSTAINVLPSELSAAEKILSSHVFHPNNTHRSHSSPKPYSDVPGPRGLPIIGNSWRFAPFIGEC